MPKLGQKGAKPVNYLLVSAAAWQPDTSVSPEDIGVERLKLGSPLVAVCHEYRRSKRRCATVREMKEGPSGSAIRS